MKKLQKGEILTVLTVAVLAILGVGTIVSSILVNGNKKKAVSTRASQHERQSCLGSTAPETFDPANYYWNVDCDNTKGYLLTNVDGDTPQYQGSCFKTHDTSNKDVYNKFCKTSTDPNVYAPTSNWCYGFGPNETDFRCMMLIHDGSGANPPTSGPQPTSTGLEPTDEPLPTLESGITPADEVEVTPATPEPTATATCKPIFVLKDKNGEKLGNVAIEIVQNHPLLKKEKGITQQAYYTPHFEYPDQSEVVITTYIDEKQSVATGSQVVPIDCAHTEIDVTFTEGCRVKVTNVPTTAPNVVIKIQDVYSQWVTAETLARTGTQVQSENLYKRPLSIEVSGSSYPFNPSSEGCQKAIGGASAEPPVQNTPVPNASPVPTKENITVTYDINTLKRNLGLSKDSTLDNCTVVMTICNQIGYLANYDGLTPVDIKKSGGNIFYDFSITSQYAKLVDAVCFKPPSILRTWTCFPFKPNNSCGQ